MTYDLQTFGGRGTSSSGGGKSSNSNFTMTDAMNISKEITSLKSELTDMKNDYKKKEAQYIKDAKKAVEKENKGNIGRMASETYDKKVNDKMKAHNSELNSLKEKISNREKTINDMEDQLRKKSASLFK